MFYSVFTQPSVSVTLLAHLIRRASDDKVPTLIVNLRC